jgi:hypothetical protein
LPFLPGVATCGQQAIIEPAALHQLLREKARLLPGRIQAVLERLTHACMMCLESTPYRVKGAHRPND